MASITDCVVEGLKYPFNDVKKILGLGALFAVINILVFAMGEVCVNIFRVIAKTSGETFALKFSQVPSNDVYIIAVFAIIIFIISLFIMGYLYDVIKFSIGSKKDLPGLGDVANIFINGVKYFAVTLIYNIVPIIVFVAGVELLSIQSGDYLVSLISFILFIICNFLLIMAVANMVDTGKFTKAFDLREIIDKIANLGWIKYIGIILFTLIIYAIIMVAVGIIMMVIAAGMAMATDQAIIISAIISIIQGLFITPYISVFFNKVYGSVYREAIK